MLPVVHVREATPTFQEQDVVPGEDSRPHVVAHDVVHTFHERHRRVRQQRRR
jgi:hypothetical protein